MKIKTFFLVMLLAFSAFPAIAEDADFTVDGFSYAITSTTNLTVEVVKGPDQAVVTVPSTVVFNKRTFRVTEIGGAAFSGRGLKSIDMPSITYISDGYYYDDRVGAVGAFIGCKNLSQVNMPSATSIGAYAFKGCDALTSVTMPAATSIRHDAFSGCDALTSVTMPAAMSIDHEAFINCKALTSVTLPVATSISIYAFSGCQSLSDIYVGSDPAVCYYSPFDKVTYATATLHVPAGCASKYKAAEYWKQFAFISEDYDPTGIKNINAEKVKVLCDNGNVNITGLKNGEKIEFYSVNGQLLGTSVANSGAVSFKTSERIVICKIAGISIKVLVK